MRIEKIDLPGVGIRHDMVTKHGRHVGVLNYRDGRRELALYDPEDPDTVLDFIELDDDESDALSDLLGHTALLSQITDFGSGALGLYTDQLVLPTDSRYLDLTLGDTQARTKTGVSIVAILRGDKVIPSPEAAEILRQDDIFVAVGTRAGLDKLEALLAHTAV
nr:MAG: K(+)/H(+) antiporter subunit khtT [actinobacterium acMicro-1]